MPRSGVTRDAKGAIDERQYQEVLIKQAEAVVQAAQALAPVGTRTRVRKAGWVTKPGDYKRGLKVVVRGKRVYASGTDWKSHWIEWGSINNSPQAPLKRGVRATGARLDEKERNR